MMSNAILINKEINGALRLDEYQSFDGYLGLEKALTAYSPKQVTDVVTKSGLQGHGGAGFPTGKKWSFLKETAPHPRILIANTDEMEPGTFKDRTLLAVNPHAVIEGMIIAAYANGADRGYFFVRPSYQDIAISFARAVDEARNAGYLGDGIMGTEFSFDIIIHRSAGRYICGESKGLIHALEGKRPHPNIEGHLTDRGLWGYPTVINNAETLCYLPNILKHGADWFRKMGSHERAPGMKLYSISGRVNTPGTFELPFGTPLRKLIFEHGGGLPHGCRFKACQPGGASTRYLTEKHLDVAMDFDSVSAIGPDFRFGTGAVMVMDHRTCLVGFTLNLIRFFARESCGWCTPCREGLPYMEDLLQRIEDGRGEAAFVPMLKEMCDHMESAYCAFAPGAAASVKGLLEDFTEEVNDHIRDKKCPFNSQRKNWPIAENR